MVQELHVDPVALQQASEHISAAASGHATDTASHDDDLTDAATRWRGESKVALHELAQRWAAQNTTHQARVSALGEKVSEAAQQFIAADSTSADAIESTPLGSDSGGPVLDMGF